MNPEPASSENRPAGDPYRLTPRLAAALAAFQSELPAIEKHNTALVEGREGRKGYKYDYADLADVSAAVLPLLGKHGMSWRTLPTMDPHGRFALKYDLTHESGESTGGWWPLTNGTPQQMGSAITYARRYTLCAVTGVAPGGEDDDGAAAQPPPSRNHRDDRGSQKRANQQRDATPTPEDAARLNEQRSIKGIDVVLGAKDADHAVALLNFVISQDSTNVIPIGQHIKEMDAETLGIANGLWKENGVDQEVTLLLLAELVVGYCERHGVGPRITTINMAGAS